MEKIIYKVSYKLKDNPKPISINDIEEDDFVHVKGTYSYEGEDSYGRSTGWETVNYDYVGKINFDKTLYGIDYRHRDSDCIFKSKELMKEYVKKNSRLNGTFEKRHIDYTFYKKESIKSKKTPEKYIYYCDTKGCNNQFTTYRNKLIKNNKHISMKIMKDGTHKCYKCCNIGRNQPLVSFNLQSNSNVILDKLLQILRENSWNAHRVKEEVVIGMILKDKVKYVIDMIEELNLKANFNFKFVKKEKFFNPDRSEKIYYYEMKK